MCEDHIISEDLLTFYRITHVWQISDSRLHQSFHFQTSEVIRNDPTSD